MLERVFLVDTLPPWHMPQISRLVKTPELHLGDQRAVAPGRTRVARQPLTISLRFQELRRQASGQPEPIRHYHFFHRDDHKVDIVLEQGESLAGVEVKASGTVRTEYFQGLRKLQEIAGDRFACGAVLYDGEVSVFYGPRLCALPI